jgi:hypothetical protein
MILCDNCAKECDLKGMEEPFLDKQDPKLSKWFNWLHESSNPHGWLFFTRDGVHLRTICRDCFMQISNEITQEISDENNTSEVTKPELVN